MKRILLFIALYSLLLAGATAQTSISPTSWSGHGASVTGPSAFTTLPATTTPGASRVSVSQWDRAGSIAYNTAGSSYNSTNWTVGGSLSTAQSASSYVFFTVTNNAATELEITAVDISTQVSATGPGTMQLLYAIGSGSDVTYGSAYSGYGRVTTLTYSSSGTIHLCAGETIKFKLYGWGALGSSGTLRINNGTSITARFADAVGAIASGSSSCAGGITLSGRDTLGVSSYSYAWTGPSGYSSTSASPTTATAAGTYTLIVTDAWSCRDTATVAVSGGSGSGSFPLTITAITDTFCTGTGGTSITASGAGAGGSYTWSPGTGLSATTGGTVTANPSASVVYTITGTTSGGCTATDSLRITVYRSPSVIGGATSVCEGATITLTDSVSGGKWTSGTTTVAFVDSTSGVVTGVTAGTVNITYTTPGGCFQWRSITVLPRPNAGVITGTRTTICAGDTLHLSTTGSGGSWTSQTTTVASVTATGVVIAITAGTDSIIYTATNSCGTARSAWGLTVLPLPVAGTLSSRTNICVFDTTLVVSSVSGGTYTSSNTAVATVSATGVVTARSAGTTTINYSVTNTCGTAVATRTITVLAQPVVTVTPPAPQYCIGDNVNLNATGAVSFTWSGSVGLSATTGGNVTASPTTTVTYSVIGTDANSCRDTATVTVTVNPLPVVVVPDITICQGSSGILTASGAVNYTWTPAATLSGSTGASVGAFPTDTTLYTVTGTDANGCVNTTTVRVNVNRIPPPPGVKAIDTLCLNEVAAPLTATGTGLLWYTSPTPGTGSAIAPTPPTAGVGSLAYWVSQTVDGCESPLQPMVVNVLVNAITGFTYNIHYGCNGDTITFTNQSQFCDRYVWHFGDDQLITSIEVNPVHAYPTVRTPTSFTIKLNGYNDICFDDSTTQVVVLQPTPHLFQLSVSPDQVIDLGGSAQLDAQGAVIYHWGPHDGSLSDPNINNPVATPQETTVYTVYGYDHNGCFDTANVTVRVITEDSTVIPNAFTPNKDGRNDIFRVLPPRGGRLVELSVFNRWGELVYHGNTGEMGWDGTYNGEPQDIGTYSYLAVLSLSSGTLQTRKGMVTLIR